ncbi:L-serine ammonia-lyase, iron-sulfur-dependent subunit beta [Clostridium sp. CM028]|uniref:L-serine ammonia-lyase, iron-sulfur-dependent subunit beta n=1 Tax=unclassified Clostridium TaxID=2614128 RepID=UPI001C0CCA32|nr:MULTISPECIES: L-serine ammonia-lyase, iron-sulfur-dependent subunit beta [unclassified Clostridium]MBU3093070.1 L-serine ammonia-lyase, iron-sulfur-dependent subunit beta [Clostridium sp. CF011]MBW9145798.1 L-serine ammonia-lyase, iron-sulfur-dependent subunit beta [Clostridium sp. CM027]MBW9149800.1 L-serine ammonia-lyase, iron-sulfur-dependent subunit beta [Clostridium sp. CM028]UVE42138.1 L-serine ammonia-lyase, iron-sulfur-dependent subunit beta [Clostridium sp. CM027]WAG71156.1 L-serin
MKNFGVFDIIGPIMVGPSSSHTAGAARLGKIAKTIVGADIKEVTFLLHGSFGKTYKGHGTDRALVAGILGMEPSDDDLRNSISIAESKGLKIKFIEYDLGQVHPNTVKLLITDVNNDYFEIMGSSIGGGNVEINEINGNSVLITGLYPTIITCHDDIPGTVAKVSDLIYEDKINIAFLKLVRGEKGKSATMTFEVDSTISDSLVKNIKKITGINKVIVINPETRRKHNDSEVS